MSKRIFDITFKKNRQCQSAEQFIRDYFKTSYYHLTYLTSAYDIQSYNNVIFKEKLVHGKIGWNFLNLNSVINVVKLSYLINKQSGSIVFLHGFTSPLQVILLKLFCSKTTKFVVQHHAEKPYINWIRLCLQKLAYRNLSAYIFASERLAEQYLLKKIIKKTSKIYEIMEGSTLFTLKNKMKCRQKLNIEACKNFIWVGTLIPRKDPLTALKAFKLYKDYGAKFTVNMIFGENELEREVRDYISEHGLSAYIKIKGKIAHENLEEFYNAADFFVSASHYEGSGYAFCESMACGCIPMVTSIPSFYTMTRKGVLGKLFKAGDHNDLFRKLIECENMNLVAERDKIRNHFDEELSFEAIALKMEQLFRNVTI